MKKSKKSRVLEEASRGNHKISNWIVPDEQYKMEELVSEASTPPQIERDGVKESDEEVWDKLEHVISKHEDEDTTKCVEYVSKDPFSTGECLVQAETVDREWK